MMDKKSINKYMAMALGLAAKAREKTYPNPMVGAVLVKGGKVIGRGCHMKAGGDHAEIRAIKDAGGKCAGASMFVTLEPCNHYGKTPPCTDAIINSGIKTVYVGMKDPNPLTGGRGIKKLRAAGIKVVSGVRRKEAEELGRKYVKFITRKMPYITVKLAQSVDGKIAARDGSSQWISSEASRRRAKRMRGRFCGIMVGINTVVNDDPFLLDEKKKGYATSRIVVDSALRIPVNSTLVKTTGKAPLIVATTDLASKTKIAKIEKLGVDVIITKNKSGKVDLKKLMKELAKRGLLSIMVEGGGQLIGSLLDGGMVDEVLVYIAPLILGGPYSSIKGRGVKNIKNAIKIKDMAVATSGGDIVVRGRL